MVPKVTKLWITSKLENSISKVFLSLCSYEPEGTQSQFDWPHHQNIGQLEWQDHNCWHYESSLDDHEIDRQKAEHQFHENKEIFTTFQGILHCNTVQNPSPEFSGLPTAPEGHNDPGPSFHEHRLEQRRVPNCRIAIQLHEKSNSQTRTAVDRWHNKTHGCRFQWKTGLQLVYICLSVQIRL